MVQQLGVGTVTEIKAQKVLQNMKCINNFKHPCHLTLLSNTSQKIIYFMRNIKMSFGLSYFENEFLTSMSSLYHVVKIADCLQTAAQVGIYYDFTAFYKKEG